MCSDSKGDSEGDFNEQQNSMSASEFEVEEVQHNETHPRRRLLKNGTKSERSSWTVIPTLKWTLKWTNNKRGHNMTTTRMTKPMPCR